MTGNRRNPLVRRGVSAAGLRKKLIVLGAALVALSLAGCGRVGPLELPPGSTADLAPNPKQTRGPDGTPVVAPQQKKPLPMDWLLN